MAGFLHDETVRGDTLPAAAAQRNDRTRSASSSNGRPAQAVAGAGRLTRALLLHDPRGFVLAAGLLLVSTLTETLGMVMIVPLLHVAGLGDAGRAGAGPMRHAVEAAEVLGVSPALPVLLLTFVLLVAVRMAVAWARGVRIAALWLGFVDRLRERLCTVAAETEWAFLVGQRRSDLVHVLGNDVIRAGDAARHVLEMWVSVALILAHGALAVVISPAMTFGTLLLGGVLLLASHPMVRRSRGLGHGLTGSGRATHAAMIDFLDGLKDAKSGGTGRQQVRDLMEGFAKMRVQRLAFIRTQACARGLVQIGAAAALGALVWLAVRHAGLSAPELLVMAMIAVRVLSVLVRLQRDGHLLAHALPAWLHADEMERALRDAAEPPARYTNEPLPLQRELTLRGVSFAYPDRARAPALAEVDFAIHAQRLVAVTGPSGAGKSTLVDLLLGLLEPNEGEIRVDGTLLAGSARRRWRRSVAYAPQDPRLSHETIRANLVRARPEATDAELWRALGLADAAESVAALPDGLQTVAGDRGVRLSGGERQRIVLARALLQHPALLVLDEPTSQLDADAERRVIEALRSLRRSATVVVVTHRPPVMEAADHVVRLEAGRVVAAGPSSPPAGASFPDERVMPVRTAS